MKLFKKDAYGNIWGKAAERLSLKQATFVNRWSRAGGSDTIDDWKVEDRSYATRSKEVTASDGCQCIDLYPTGSNLVYHRVTIYDEETGKQLASVTVYTPYCLNIFAYRK